MAQRGVERESRALERWLANTSTEGEPPTARRLTFKRLFPGQGRDGREGPERADLAGPSAFGLARSPDPCKRTYVFLALTRP